MVSRLTAEQRFLRQVTEVEFLSQVIDLARICGYRSAHFRPAWSGRGYRTPVQGDGVGFPDLVLVGRGRVIVAELKREAASGPGPEQQAWLDAFRATGTEVYVWRPRDLEWIATLLTEPTTPDITTPRWVTA